ncbi:UNVERIFIED_ORG: CDP-glycerol glycerophosphotransferase [Actinomadura viridilutea]|uniref:bifunctional glycosyltransferase/CDP-glycerol:glycerophosphate glycerophosphotransferase n=1 Tax=Actinomadura rubrobrunea TaxID=115335 RepID=UPI000B213E23|nr:bifunctional glycosyltransferase family 2 protein/CDP-glycerol:glycerophosphate glycerophosphotransferase [Actinomadura rubrobrunea]
MPHRISVIVPAHGTAAELNDTLRSLAAQTYGDLEVLVVDGGTGAAAEADLPDDRFRLIRRGAPSRGAARGIGVAEAEGEFLAFADDGDVLPKDALAALHSSLTTSGSDFAAGNIAVRREGGSRPSRRHREAFASAHLRTHVRKHPALLDDRLVTGKLFRRAFWDRHALAFPDVNRDDDLAVAVPAYFLAEAVDVLPEVVLRRARDTAPEPTADPQAVADGFAAVAAALAALDGRWTARDRRRFLASVLNAELRAFLDALPDATDEDRAAVVKQAAAHASWLDSETLAELPSITRLKWHLAGRERRTELVKVVRYARGKPSPAIVRSGLRRYVVHPYWKDEKVGVPDEVYLARTEVALRSRTHEVAWRDGKLFVTGEAYINAVSMRRRWTSVKSVVLRSGRRRVVLRARQTRKPGKASGPWTGFEFVLDPKKLRRGGAWTDGRWDVEAVVFNAGVLRSARLRGGSSGSAARPPYHYVDENVRIVPQVVDGTLRIDVETVTAKATALRWDDDALEIEGLHGGGEPALGLAVGDEVVPVSATVTGERFTARVPLPEPQRMTDPRAIDDTCDWAVLIDGRPLVLAEGVDGIERFTGGRELTAGRDASGYLRVQSRSARLTVTECAWRPDGALVLAGTHRAGDTGEIVLRSRGRRKEYAFGVVRGDDGVLRAEIPVAAVPSVAGVLPLRQGRYDLLFRTPGGRALAVSVDPAVSSSPPAAVEVSRRGYEVELQRKGLVVRVTGDVPPEERAAATTLRAEARQRAAKEGLRDAVVFSCFNGRQYSDSPKAIHLEMVARGLADELEQLWVVNDQQVELPDTLTPLRLNGREWHEALATSRYIITNHRLGDWFQRHPDQVVLQTWHGTPLKKIGRDVKEVHFAYAPGMKQAYRSLAKAKGKGEEPPAPPSLPEWTHLLSPNPFSTEIFRRAFAFEGEIIEAGYPRNDLLYHPEADRIAAQVRARLGVPAGKRVVLYAPTWRDDQYYSRGRYKFDLRLDLDRARAALGEDHVLLVRLHSNVVDGVPEDGEFVKDVSLYPDITDLYLIADVLVTDYSSVMFDFAGTRRPMLFFTYDLADYRDRLRGFYLDFEAEAPGPLLETSDAVIEAIRDIEPVAKEYRDNYDAFVERFCPLDDGKASARVVDRLFPR